MAKVSEPDEMDCSQLSSAVTTHTVNQEHDAIGEEVHCIITSGHNLDDPSSAIKGSDVMANGGIAMTTSEHAVVTVDTVSLATETSSSEVCSNLSDNHKTNPAENSTVEAPQYHSIIYVNHGDGQVTIPADHSILLSGSDSQGGSLHLDEGNFTLNTTHVEETDLADNDNGMLHEDSKQLVNISTAGLTLNQQALSSDAQGLQTLMVKTPNGELVQVIPISSLEDLTAIKSGNLVQMMPMGVGGLQSALLVAAEGDETKDRVAGHIVDMGSGLQISDTLTNILVPQNKPLPPGTPMWASRIHECEKIGDSYRGWVESETDLDLLLTYHRQNTNSFWGTRQSPSPAKPSTRLMWKSQYVHFDGVPFINAGSRAIVLECQFGPRRKGAQAKRQLGENYKGEFRKTCPARIYIKKVKKFPEFSIDINQDKKMMKLSMDKAFMSLREKGIDQGGQERYYVQLPTEDAHEFHGEEIVDGPHRLDPRVSDRIRELVSKGETRLYVIRRALRVFVEKELFSGTDNFPEKHNLTFYPTVNDLQNHIHQAIQDIEAGLLPLTASHMTVQMLSQNKDDGDEDSEQALLHRLSGHDDDDTHTESVTVTLTQNPDQDGQHVISKVETHLSDGTTQITTNLTPETARLLSKLHPNLFPSQGYFSISEQGQPPAKRLALHSQLSSLHGDHDDGQLSSIHGDHDNSQLTSLHGDHDNNQLSSLHHGDRDDSQLSSLHHGNHDDGQLSSLHHGNHDESQLSSLHHGDHEDGHDVDMSMHSVHQEAQYIVMENPGGEIRLGDGSSTLMMDAAMVSGLKGEGVHLTSIETEDVSRGLVKLEEDSEIMSHYPVEILDQGTCISTGMEEHIQVDSMGGHIADTTSIVHQLHHPTDMDVHNSCSMEHLVVMDGDISNSCEISEEQIEHASNMKHLHRVAEMDSDMEQSASVGSLVIEHC